MIAAGVVLVVAIVSAALFSAAEMAFISANRSRLRQLAESGHAAAGRYLESFRHPARHLATAMTGVTVSHITAGAVATWALLPWAAGAAPLLVAAGLTPIMLVLGEVVPKAVARERGTAVILRLFRLIEAAAWVFAPLTWGANQLVRRALRLVGQQPSTDRQFVSREELKLLLQMEPDEADVTTLEAEMIDRIFGLGEKTVREVMVPMGEVAALPDTATPDDAVQLVHERGFSRIPVFQDRPSAIRGVVTAMDLLRRGAQVPDLRPLMRPATFIPESKRIDELLGEMQKARVQLAVVVDEYGGPVGIVTVEDIVEEIVGEIRDEHDRAPAMMDRLPDGSYRVAGRLGVEELNEALDWDLPRGGFETVAGLVLSTMHRIPLVGEEVHIGRYTFTVLEADARRVVTVRITPPAGSGPGP